MSFSLSSQLSLTPSVRIKMKNILLLSASVVCFSYISTLKSGERSVTKSSESSTLEVSESEDGLVFKLSNSGGVGKTETIKYSHLSLVSLSSVWEAGCAAAPWSASAPGGGAL